MKNWSRTLTLAMPLLCSTTEVSYEAKWKLVVMWVEDWPVDDGCILIHMMLMHEIHVSELRIETNFNRKSYWNFNPRTNFRL